MAPLPTARPGWLNPARQIVAEFEGCVLTAYPDPGTGGDPWTVGYGHTGPEVRRGLKISQEMASAWLTADLNHAAGEVFRLLPMAGGWSAPRQAALISFVFNVGAGALDASTLRRRLLAGEDPNTVVRSELPRWNKGGGRVMPGLVRRRDAEVALFLSGGPGHPVWPPGMVGPTMRPTLAPGDHHLIANDINETMTAWSADGRKLWAIPCLCRGQGGETQWRSPRTDTPPSLFKVGRVWRDYETLGPNPAIVPAELVPFGWYFLELVDQQGLSQQLGRSGFGIHGGGSGLGARGSWAPYQPLLPTWGCPRVHNADLRDKIVPLLDRGTIWLSVLQEAG